MDMSTSYKAEKKEAKFTLQWARPGSQSREIAALKRVNTLVKLVCQGFRSPQQRKPPMLLLSSPKQYGGEWDGDKLDRE